VLALDAGSCNMLLLLGGNLKSKASSTFCWLLAGPPTPKGENVVEAFFIGR
jgi:hypothetical protein